MSEPVGREWRFYIDDMIAFAEKVVAYTNGLDQRGFVASVAPERTWHVQLALHEEAA